MLGISRAVYTCICSRNKAPSKVLLYLRAVSGLKINLDKLELLHVGTVDNVRGFASILGCKVYPLPMK